MPDQRRFEHVPDETLVGYREALMMDRATASGANAPRTVKFCDHTIALIDLELSSRHEPGTIRQRIPL